MNKVQTDILNLLNLELDVARDHMEELKGPAKLDFMCKIYYLERAIEHFKIALRMSGESDIGESQTRSVETGS